MSSQSQLNLPPVAPWPEPVNGIVLLNELLQLKRRFAVLPKSVPAVCSLFVVHTYAYELRDVCTYLGVESPIRRWVGHKSFTIDQAEIKP